VSPDTLIEFLRETFAMWRVEVTVERGQAPLVATMRGQNGTIASVERCSDPDFPFRWLVRWRKCDQTTPAPREVRPRSCASLVGVLSALRSAFDVERGSAIRIAPGSSETASVSEAR
jgi:hypothetical protein